MTKPDMPSTLQKDVMDRIHRGSVRMKPRIYFTVLWLTGVIATGAAGISVAYLISMASYIVRIQTAHTPAYGARQNLSEAIASFPWIAVIVSTGLVIGAIWLMRKYSRVYRYSITRVVLIFLAISCILGIGLSYTDIGKPRTHGNNTDATGQRGYGGGNRSAEKIEN